MDLKDIAAIFKNIFGYLHPGGYFIFDILNEKEVSPCEPFDCPFSETIRAEFQILVEQDIINLKTRVFEHEKFVFEENIYEKLHDVQTVCKLLQQAGFDLFRCADRLLPKSNPSTTWYIIARKPTL